MTEHSSHMPRRVLEVQRCCFEYLGAECLPEFSSRNSCCYPGCYPQDIFEINNQPFNHRQAAVLIIPLCLDLHALTGWQLNNQSSPRQLNIKGEATISGTHGTQPHHVQKVLTESSNTKSFTATGHPKYYLKMISFHETTNEKFPYFPPPANIHHGLRLARRSPQKKTSTHKKSAPIQPTHPIVGLPLH